VHELRAQWTRNDQDEAVCEEWQKIRPAVLRLTTVGLAGTLRMNNHSCVREP
jgi:hypothetical protein